MYESGLLSQLDMANDPASGNVRNSAGPGFANTLRESLSGALVFVSARDETLVFSHGAESLLGFSATDGVVNARQLPSTLLALARQGLAGTAVRNRHLRFQAAGHPQSANVSVLPLTAGQEVRGALLVLNDAVRDRELERHLHQLNSLANAGTLAASMAHEIKNALVAGKTLVDLLLEKDSGNELADLVRRELGRIDAIVVRMLRLAGPRDSGAALAPVHLHEVLDYAFRLVAPELDRRSIVLEQSLQASPDLVSGEAGQLQQAVLNLLLNSVEALGSGGQIAVGTSLHAGDGMKGGGPQICLKLSDTGPGIAPEHLGHVFEPFFTTKANGTGLGMAITRRIISEHGGVIGVKSQPGQGTSFEILFPIAAFARS